MPGNKRNFIAVLGMFDGMHIGHRAVFENARFIKMMTGQPIAVFTFSGSSMLPKYGGRRDVLLMSDSDKREAMREQGAVMITEAGSGFFDHTPEEFFELIIKRKFNALHVVCGRDFRFGKDRAGDVYTLNDLCNSCGIRLSAVPITCGGEPYLPVSSSRIRDLIREGETEAAAELLGHEMYYTLPVLHGKELGRTMGFPTINQVIPDYMVHPKRGVYASLAEIPGDEREYPAITDIGVKPTVGSDGTEIMETHMIGYTGDLYDKTVRVKLHSFIRPEQKFEGLDDLQKQLISDKKAAEEIFSERIKPIS